MSNHKRKKKKEKKSIEWGTPKIIQYLKTRDIRVRNYNKKKKVCKHWKGEHVFVEVDRNYYKWIDRTFLELRCACGKKDIKVVDGNQLKKS